MKSFLLHILLLLSCPAIFATNFYLANNGKDSNTGTSPNSPWKSLNKLNNSMGQIDPGDTIFFNRGDVFYGQINFTRNGMPSQPIVFSAYGDGAKPIITGSAKLTNWTKTPGSNIWTCTTNDTVAYLYANDKIKTLARYPNSGYITIDNGNTTYLQANGLKGGSNYWKNASVRFRSTRWTYEDRRISASNTSGRLDFVTPTKYTAKADWGFFLDNKLDELDMEGEWYFEHVTGKVYFWPEGGKNPNNMDMYASRVPYGILIPGDGEVHDLVIENLEFRHQEHTGIRIPDRDSENTVIKNCDFFSQGETSIFIAGTNANVKDCFFEGTLGRAVKGHYVYSGNYTNNIMRNIGMQDGYGISGNQNMNGFHFTRSENVYIAYNDIDSVGYTGITCYCKYSTIERNTVDWACLRLDDGGAIYAFDTQTTQTVIKNNFVKNVPGYPIGTNDINKDPAHGIYMDYKVSNMVIEDNTIINVARSGIFINTNNHDNLVQNNVIYNPGREGIQVAETNKANSTLNNTFANNIVYGMHDDVRGVRLLSKYGTEGNMGVFQDNKFINPYTYFIMESGDYATMKDRTLEEWDNVFPNQTVADKESPFQFTGYEVSSELSNNQVDNGEFDADMTGWSYTNGANVDAGWIANGGLDQGCFKMYMLNGSSNVASLTTTLNEVSNVGSYYRLKYSVISPEYGTMEVLILDPSNQIIRKEVLPHTPTRREYEFISHLNQNFGTLKLQFRLKYKNGKKFRIDNIAMHEVEVDAQDPFQKGKLFTNKTNSNKTITLTGVYYDMEGNLMGPSITLAPWTSTVLFQEEGGSEPGFAPKAVMMVDPDQGPAPLLANFDATQSTDPDGTISTYLWDFGNGDTGTGSLTSYSYDIPGTYTAQLIVIDQGGLSDTATHTVVVTPPGGGGGGGNCDLSAGWFHMDIGNTAIAGDVCEDSTGLYTMNASGKQLYGKSDHFHFVYREMAGDGWITAKINSVDQANVWSIAGIMMRESLTSASKNAFMAMGAQERYAFQSRETDGEITDRTASPAGSIPFPAYVRLVRTSDDFMGFYSTDGLNWQLIASATIPMNTNIYIGLAASSYTNQQDINVEIEDVNFSASASFPVELTHFGARFEGSQLRLDWVTATELNNDFFTVERSQDGVFYESIGNVEGAGTVQEPVSYYLYDQEPWKGRSYYRLKQTDLDGTFAYVATIQVINDIELRPKLTVFPNPVTDRQISLAIQGLEAQQIQKLFLMDFAGRELAQINAESTSFQWMIPASIPVGTYYLVGIHQDGLIRSPIVIR